MNLQLNPLKSIDFFFFLGVLVRSIMCNEANISYDFNSVRGAWAFNFPPSITNTTWLTELYGMGWCLFAHPPPLIALSL